MRLWMGVLVAVGLLTGCKGDKKEAPAAPAAPTGMAAPGARSPHGAAMSQGLRGRVLEAQDASEYTYLRLQTPAGEQWAAVPSTPAQVGADVVVLDPQVMEDFQSKTLGRTFPRIVFGSGIEGASGAVGSAQAMAHPHTGSAAGADTAPIQVEKAQGKEGHTVAELHARKQQLEGKPVAVRGKVVKLSSGILGRNWLHLSDGTGSEATKDSSVVVTTQETVAKGDVVTARGKVTLNKDIGSGYVYPLLIEDAALTK
jgi:hypothetical protein